jgi:VWFA-related protein
MTGASRFVRYLVPFLAAFMVVLTVGAQQRGQPPGTIRTRITLVPLDVRVVDRNGKPVTDLTQEDFTITENGRPQEIRHFSVQALAADPGAVTTAVELRKMPASDLAPQKRRVFLLLLGRGRMTGPSRELEALQEFVSSKLLPQDHVAVLAYNRATDFTSDHKTIADVVARFKARHTKIEALLAQYFSGLRAVYGAKTIPPHIQREIDAVFESAGNLRPREISPGQIVDGRGIAADARRTADELQRAEILSTRPPEAPSLPDSAATTTAEALDVSFDDYVASQVELMHDLGNLYAGIEYMRHLDGEKHLAFVTPRGLSMPRAENDRNVAAVASDARVAIDIVYTGGTVGAAPPRIVSGPNGSRIVASPVPSPAAVFGQTFNIQSLRRIAEITGGQVSAFRYGKEAFARIDQSTRFQYLLGYYPSNATMNGTFRRIDVKVNRPGLVVSYRRGYFASPQLVPLDRREFLTFTRVSAAGRFAEPLKDIALTLNQPDVFPGPGGGELTVSGTIDLSRVKFDKVEDRHNATLDIGIYAGDARERVLGETMKKVELRLLEDSYRTTMAKGVPFSARIAYAGEPAYVKVIVYDYASDLLGSSVVKLKKK